MTVPQAAQPPAGPVRKGAPDPVGRARRLLPSLSAPPASATGARLAGRDHSAWLQGAARPLDRGGPDAVSYQWRYQTQVRPLLAIPDNRQRGLGHHGSLGATRPIAGRSAAPPERPDRRDRLRLADFISANVRS